MFKVSWQAVQIDAVETGEFKILVRCSNIKAVPSDGLGPLAKNGSKTGSGTHHHPKRFVEAKDDA